MAPSKNVYWIITITIFLLTVTFLAAGRQNKALKKNKKKGNLLVEDESPKAKGRPDQKKGSGKNRPILVYEDFASEQTYALFSPDGKYILSGGAWHDPSNPIYLWNTATGKMIKSFRGNQYVFKAHFTPDSKALLAHGVRTKKIDLMSGQVVWQRGGSSASEVSPDGKYIISENKSEFALIETDNGQTVATFEGKKRDDVLAMGISTGGKLMAVSYEEDMERAIRVYDARIGEEIRRLKGHLKDVTSVVFSPDSRYLLSGSEDNTIKLWDLRSGQEIRAYKSSDLLQLKVLWSKTETNFSPVAIKFSPDGKQFIADHIYYSVVVDVETGQLLHTSGIPDLQDLHEAGMNASFSPDYSMVIKLHKTNLKLYDTSDQREVATLVSFKDDDNWLVTSDDGRFDGSGGAMEQIYYQLGNDFLPLESFYERYYTPGLFTRKLLRQEFGKQSRLDNIKVPPSLKMNTSVDGGFTSHQKNIEVTIQATDQGGGIDEIRLYQNAKLIRSQKSQGKKQTMTARVTLVSEYDGENYFKAVAFGKDRTESKPVKATVSYTGSTDRMPHLYLFAVGINNYKNPKYELNYAHADATAFIEALRSDNKLFADIKVIFIEDDNATKKNILKAFEEVQGQILEQDVFVFYYAGHGVLSDGTLEDKDYYLILHDVVNMFGDSQTLMDRSISTTELKELSQNLNAQKQIFFMDACQSGGAVELLTQRSMVDEKAIAQLARSTGTFWLAASESEQFATEFETLGHGVFTYSLLKGMSGQADVGKDGIITVRELSTYLEKTVPVISEKYKGLQQYPLSYGFGQDFPIILNDN